MFQKHLKVSPRIGLYGFFATLDFRPAWNADRYHFTVCMNLCSGVSKSGMLQNRSGCAKKSAYISSNDRRSRMNVGKTTSASGRREIERTE